MPSRLLVCQYCRFEVSLETCYGHPAQCPACKTDPTTWKVCEDGWNPTDADLRMLKAWRISPE